MNKATIGVEGLDTLRRDFTKISEETRAGLSMAIKATALDINRSVKKRIQRGPKTGVTYYRIFDAESGYMKVTAGNPDSFGPSKLVAAYKSDGGVNLSPKHTSSAPGEAPATDTGLLASSQYFKMPDALTATVGSRLIYAYYLEFGTRKIKPRPAWIPAIEELIPKFNQRVDKVLKEATR